VASGTTFPDALAGGANMAAHRGPVLLATLDAPLPASLADYVRANRSIRRTILYGGMAAMSSGVSVVMAQMTAGRG
jgi:hypothetical protein